MLANVQVVLVGVIAWLALGERPERSSLLATPVVLVGVVLISGAVGSGAYGDDPALGAVYGLATGLTYAFFLLILRAVNRDLRRPGGPLFDATLSGAVCAALGGLAVGDVDFLPGPKSQAWLVTLALSSQVLGWLLISFSLPRLPALVTSIVLTIQPVGSVLLGVALFDEAPSAPQLLGVGLVLGGVTIATLGRQARREPAAEPA